MTVFGNERFFELCWWYANLRRTRGGDCCYASEPVRGLLVLLLRCFSGVRGPGWSVAPTNPGRFKLAENTSLKFP